MTEDNDPATGKKHVYIVYTSLEFVTAEIPDTEDRVYYLADVYGTLVATSSEEAGNFFRETLMKNFASRENCTGVAILLMSVNMMPDKFFAKEATEHSQEHLLHCIIIPTVEPEEE